MAAGRSQVLDKIDVEWANLQEAIANIPSDQLGGALRSYGRGAYVNSLGDEGETRVREAYGSNYERLARLKKKYDPSNLFRLNQNIVPAA